MTRSESDPSRPDAAKRQRIAKLMARAGLCSRRDAEAWIVDGRVSVNGTKLTSPAVDVSAEDVILVDDAPLPVVDKTRLFLFHKPRGLVTTDHDPEGRATVADFLAENWPEGPRVVTVGRLDINTEGLLLLTNDGGLARVLELPQTGWVRRYRVRAKGSADPSALDALAQGVTIDGLDYAGIEAKLDRVQGSNCWLTMGLREGKNREVKRVLEHVGLEVNRLIRLSFGPFQLLDLPEGAVEEVRTRVLRDQLGPALSAQAGVDLGDAAPAAPSPKPQLRERRPEPRGRTEPAMRAERGDRSKVDRPPRAPTGRPFTPRMPRRDAADGAPPPKRERPVSGTRKHVSTLRAEKAGAQPSAGARTRIERTDTRDRRDRTVKVERLVPTRAAADAATPRRAPRTRPGHEPPPRDRPSRDDRPRGRDERRGGRDAPPGTGGRGRPAEARKGRRGPAGDRRPERDRSSNAPPRRAHASPSAAGKRERIARSGGRGGPEDRGTERPRERSDSPRGRSDGPRERSAGPSERRGGTGARGLRENDRSEPRRSAPGKPDASKRPRPDKAARPPRGSNDRASPSRPPGSRPTRPKGPPKGRDGRPPRGGPSKPRR